MRLPDGYVNYMFEVHNIKIDPSTHVLLPKKAIYGLVLSKLPDNGGKSLRK
jgi:hypothetical protein